MFKMFFLWFLILPVFSDTAVCPPGTTTNLQTLYIFVDEEVCLITDNWNHITHVVNDNTKSYFMINREVPCFSDINAAYWVLIPDTIKATVEVKKNLRQRICNIERNNIFSYKCYFNFYYKIEDTIPTVQTEKVTQMSTTALTSTTEPTEITPESSVMTTQSTLITTELVVNTTESPVDTDKKADSYLYLYVTVGVVAFCLIVVIQTVCIILYKRKVAKSRRTLNYVLNSRSEDMRDKKVRYSVGPVKKPVVKNPIPQNEDVYESIESLAEPSPAVPRAKSTPSPGRSPRNETINRSLRERPKLPLPHEIQALQYEDMRGNPRPQTTGVTLPHGMQGPREMLPHGMQSPVMEHMRGTRIPPSAGAPLPHGMQPPRAMLPHGMQPPREMLPHEMQSPVMESRTPQNKPFQPTASFSQPPASIARPRPNAPISNISRIHAEKLRTIQEERRFATDSSDEEWTYEQLPPMEKYLK